ncbi:PH domain-containing protein [Sporobolomyces koalae]|uniref:PH domain-containing protein n=1 Tax=Sporobolomyces koalae TaxID=500713 RepID=UPI00316B0907
MDPQIVHASENGRKGTLAVPIEEGTRQGVNKDSGQADDHCEPRGQGAVDDEEAIVRSELGSLEVNDRNAGLPSSSISSSIDSRSINLSSPATSSPACLRPLATASTAPTSFFPSSADVDEGSDAVSDLSFAFSRSERSRKSRSKIYGRYGEEVEYDFTALSDVPERSEKSSVTVAAGPTLLERQRPASSAGVSLPSRSEAVQSSMDHSSGSKLSRAKSTPTLSQNGGEVIVDRRIDATAQLLGPSSSGLKAIFGTRIRQASELPQEPTSSILETPKPVRSDRSPIRQASPEIMRRASRFAGSVESSSGHAGLASSNSAAPTVDLAPSSADFVQEELRRRRIARDVRLASIRELYQPSMARAEVSGAAPMGTWREVECRERAQAEQNLIASRPTMHETQQIPDQPRRSTELPLPPADAIICEGYLRVPPGTEVDPSEPVSPPPEWNLRYSVLTSETLSFRPTDRNSLKTPIIALCLADCNHVEEGHARLSTTTIFRPFGVRLKNGEQVWFACERGSERVRWIVALEEAITSAKHVAVQSANVPGDSPPSDSPSNSRSVPCLALPGPISSYDSTMTHVEKEQPSSPRLCAVASASAANQPSQNLLSSEVARRPVQSPASSCWSISQIQPSSVQLRPLPQRPIPSHARSRSMHSIRTTLDLEPPHRPEPTRPKTVDLSFWRRKDQAVADRLDASTGSDSAVAHLELFADTDRYQTHPHIDTNIARKEQDLFRDPSTTSVHSSSTVGSYQIRQDTRSAVSPLAGNQDRPFTNVPPSNSRATGFRLPLGKKRTWYDSRAPPGTSMQMGPSAVDSAKPSRVPMPAQETVSPRSMTGSVIPLETQEVFRKLEDGSPDQSSIQEADRYHQERQARAISALATWVTEDTKNRKAEYAELAADLKNVERHLSNLPQQLRAVLHNASDPVSDRPASPDTALVPQMDSSAEEGIDQVAQRDRVKQTKSGKMFGINPQSSFARAKNHEARVSDEHPSEGTAKPKGPRMPGIRLWGTPDPVTDRLSTSQRHAEATYANGETAPQEDGDGDIHERDPARSDSDQALAGESTTVASSDVSQVQRDTIDFSAFSDTLAEILRLVKELENHKPTETTTSLRDSVAQSATLTAAERAELKEKRAQIARIEKATNMSNERTAKINDMVAAIIAKNDKNDAALAELSKSVAKNNTTMDPALTAEIKKLLGVLQSGVDGHIKDFRGQLTSEVQRMFKEVGKLRDEKKSLQADIAELMAFHAKYGGSVSRTAMGKDGQCPVSQDEPAPTSAKSSGFYGPRALR